MVAHMGLFQFYTNLKVKRGRVEKSWMGELLVSFQDILRIGSI